MSKIVLQIRLALRVERQIHGRQEGKQAERENTAGHRERRQPARKETSCHLSVLNPNLPGGQRSQRQALAERSEKTGRAEYRAPAALHCAALGIVFAKGKSRAPQHNADQHGRQRNVQRRHHRRKPARKTGEEQNDHENQPHMVGLPNGTDGVGDGFSLPLARGPAASKSHMPPPKSAPPISA